MSNKTCTRCAQCVTPKRSWLDWQPELRCGDPTVRDPVTGAAFVPCATMRARHGRCTPDGVLWQALPDGAAVARKASLAIWPGGRGAK